MRKPTLAFENELRSAYGNGLWVVGIDEVGVAALAGPLVAAAVAFEPGWHAPWFKQLNDSKALAKVKIYELAEMLRTTPEVAIGIGFTPAQDIDRFGIVQARVSAMRAAYQQCYNKIICRDPQARIGAIIDDRRLLTYDIARKAPAIYADKADSRSLTVAAASIVAKDARDTYMKGVARLLCEDYGFSTNVGYGARKHYQALKNQGPTWWHRRSFRLCRAET